MNSNCFNLGEVFGARMQALAAELGASWADNPPLPIDMARAQKLVFLLTRGDKLQDQAGQREERRRMRVIVGAVAITAAGRRDADALHFAVRDLLKSLAFRQALLATGARPEELRETDIEPDLREVASQGSVVMSAYELDYFQTYPSFAL